MKTRIAVDFQITRDPHNQSINQSVNKAVNEKTNQLTNQWTDLNLIQTYIVARKRLVFHQNLIPRLSRSIKRTEKNVQIHRQSTHSSHLLRPSTNQSRRCINHVVFTFCPGQIAFQLKQTKESSVIAEFFHEIAKKNSLFFRKLQV